MSKSNGNSASSTNRVAVNATIVNLMKASVGNHHRTVFVIIGDRAKDLIPTIYQLGMKFRPPQAKPSVLWCYKSELDFSSHRKKRIKQVKKLMQRGLFDSDKDDPFLLFTASTKINWCYYKESERILGQTFGMCVLQDFEALTPNLLARTIETVEGGGSIVFLLKKVESLKRLYSLTMDSHAKFLTASQANLIPRFNERFILSLLSCPTCVIVDEEFKLLPITKSSLVTSYTEEEGKKNDNNNNNNTFNKSKNELANILINLSKTKDQADAIDAITDCIVSAHMNWTVSLLASRGRGKSAALGICLAMAIAHGYSNVFVTAPSPDNLTTLFEFAVKALEALKYVEHADFELITPSNNNSNNENNGVLVAGSNTSSTHEDNQPKKKSILRINVFRNHRQTIQYIPPNDYKSLTQAEMLVIDEAAAIPLPMVRKLMGNYLVLISSTVDGYEGTGRSLSLKLLEELRTSKEGKRNLRELVLNQPIRYGMNDPAEKWLHELLCLDAKAKPIISKLPHPNDCELFFVDRDTLFSKHKVAETFLRNVVGLLMASHYKNSPNDLQLLSDAPAHRLAVLTNAANGDELPDVLCVVQFAFEGKIPQQSVREELGRGNRSAGDLIPWTLSQQFQDDNFPQLFGCRIVRIATHPDAMGMGYGARAMELLTTYFSEQATTPRGGEVNSFECGFALEEEDDSEKLRPRKQLRPLLVAPVDLPLDFELDWLGVSFGLTDKLFSFWSEKCAFSPVYLRQTPNETTGEFTCMMLRGLSNVEAPWVKSFAGDFLRRFMVLLAGPFRDESYNVALAILLSVRKITAGEGERKTDLEKTRFYITVHDQKRLEAYSRNLTDFHLILDIVPRITELWGEGLLNLSLSPLQVALFVALGLQRKSIEAVCEEFKLPVHQLLAFLNKAIRKVVQEMFTEETRDAEKEIRDEEQLLLDKNFVPQPGQAISILTKKKDRDDTLEKEAEEEKKRKHRELQSKRFEGKREKRHKR